MRTTKDLIIETTIKLIQSAGSDPEQITMRDISKEAGIALSQINYHFTSKENLIAICVQRMIRDVISMFDDALKQAENLGSVEKLKHMVNLTFGFLYENENLSRISILTDYQNGAPGDNTSLTLKAYFPLIETVCKERNIPNAGLVSESILFTLQGAFLRSNILKDELQINLRNPQQRAAFVNSVLEQQLR